MPKPTFKSSEQKERDQLVAKEFVGWAAPVFQGKFGEVAKTVYEGIDKKGVPDAVMQNFAKQVTRLLENEKLPPETKRLRVDALADNLCREHLDGDKDLTDMLKFYWTQLHEMELFARKAAVDHGPLKTPLEHAEMLFWREHLVGQLGLFDGDFTVRAMMEAFETNIRIAFGNPLPAKGRGGLH